MMETPSDYKAGCEKARLVDKEAADNYIAHTRVGDPVMDAVVEELASLPRDQVHRFLRAGMDQDLEGMRNAPQLLRDSSSTRRSPTRTGLTTTPSRRASAPSRETPSSCSRPSSPACCWTTFRRR